VSQHPQKINLRLINIWERLKNTALPGPFYQSDFQTWIDRSLNRIFKATKITALMRETGKKPIKQGKKDKDADPRKLKDSTTKQEKVVLKIFPAKTL
jgi:hypothetical protein